MPLLSVIITNYNGKKYLKDCIDSLRKNSFSDFEVIIVDNGSSDASLDFIRQDYPHIRALELGDNLGLSIASNRAGELAQGKYLFFYNNDTIADRVMLEELVSIAESDPKIGVLGCRTLTYDGTSQINCGVEMDIFGYPYGKGIPFYVDAAIFIRRDVFEEIGGFDEKMFLYCEDRDLCWRVRLYGYKVIAVPAAVFRHDSVCLAGTGQFSTNIKRRFMNEAFTLRMLIKNYSFLSLCVLLPVYFLINLAEIIVYLLRGEFKVVRDSYLAAYEWNFKNIKDTLSRRGEVQRNRKISDRQIMKSMCKASGKWLLLRRAGMPCVDTKVRDLSK